MLERASKFWEQTTWYQKLKMIKNIVYEGSLILVLAFIFFWTVFLISWIFTLFIGISPYYQEIKPTFHIRNVMPNKLITVFVNEDLKQQICLLGPNNTFFNDFTVPYHEYCNIQQQKLPIMRAPVHISLSNIDTSKISYVKGCIKHKNRQISCQKYPSSTNIQILHDVEMYGLQYLQIYLQILKFNQSIQISGPLVHFEENCWMITKLIKKYYSIFMLIYSLSTTLILTLCAILYRINKKWQKNYIQQISKPINLTIQLQPIRPQNTSKIQQKQSAVNNSQTQKCSQLKPELEFSTNIKPNHMKRQ